jgi:hypothetical protein
MATAITKQPVSNSSLVTAKQSYMDSQTRTLAQMLDIMGTQYRMPVTPELAKFWKDSLIGEAGLSPEQIRRGFMTHFSDPETSGFPPIPGDIIRCAPEATDKPRKIHKPDCPDCRGTGWRLLEVDAKTTDVFYKPGKKRKVVEDCYCVRIVYAGQEFTPEPRLLSAPPNNKESAQIMEDLASKLPGLNKVGQSIPKRTFAPALTEEQIDQKKAEALKLAQKFHTEEIP